MYYLTLTLTLKTMIGFENEFGIANKYLVLSQVRSLQNLTLNSTIKLNLNLTLNFTHTYLKF